MLQHKANARPAEGRTSLYQDITDRIIVELEAGRLPWVQPWTSSAAGLGMPFNAATGRRYSGVNILTLWAAVCGRGFAGHGFLTFRQAIGLGGAVRRGERGVTVVFAHVVEGRPAKRTDPDDDGKRPIPFLKRFTVFSVDQCEGLPETVAPQPKPIAPGLIQPEAEALISATNARFRIGGPSAYYDPIDDQVVVPRPEDFHEAINWHRTAFHELGHWTGHPSRLDRDQASGFGSLAYGREELVAEMAGAFICATLGITPTVRHADYIGAWLDIIRADNRAVVRAASAASKAADYVLAFRSGSAASATLDDGFDETVS